MIATTAETKIWGHHGNGQLGVGKTRHEERNHDVDGTFNVLIFFFFFFFFSFYLFFSSFYCLLARAERCLFAA